MTNAQALAVLRAEVPRRLDGDAFGALEALLQGEHVRPQAWRFARRAASAPTASAAAWSSGANGESRTPPAS